jgi:hypothetical protein
VASPGNCVVGFFVTGDIMQVHIRNSSNSWETISVPTEEDAMRMIKHQYPHAVSGPWETDRDRLTHESTGRMVKCVYVNQPALDRNCPPIAKIRKDRDEQSAESVAANQTYQPFSDHGKAGPSNPKTQTKVRSEQAPIPRQVTG